MNAALPIVADQLRIAAPCDRKWEDMPGDDRRRYCGDCRLFVYNVPVLSPEELVAAIEASEGRFCGRLYTRADGTVMTEDCPVGLAARARRKVAAAFTLVTAMAASAIGALSGISGGIDGASGRSKALQTTTSPVAETPSNVAMEVSTVAAPQPPPQPEIEYEAKLGDIVVEPRRIRMGKIVGRPNPTATPRPRHEPSRPLDATHERETAPQRR